ncbi:MAG: serine/threonine protein kinase, partial [Chloroflexota bacterium]|nr:serine/threonine protein kinase [Chloroflexota bacterium]
ALPPQEVQEARDTYEREVQLLAKLAHPRLPRLYDAFSTPGHCYLARDFIAGETLEQYLEAMPDGRLPWQEVLSIGVQLCDVLDYLHAQEPPIVFRDLKPANVIRARDGNLTLIDFGIARHFKAGQAKDTGVFGSPGYAAPEQYGRAQTTPQTDLYSLGVLLHQLLTGLDPAQTPFRFALDASHASSLRSLLSQLVELDARQRPASAALVQQQLQSLLSVSHPSLLSYEGHRWMVRSLSWSPDGRTLASGSSDGTIHLWDAASGETRWTHSAGAGAYVWAMVLAWSPNGRQLAMGDDAGHVRVCDLRETESGQLTGEWTRTYRGHTSWINALSWSPDGSRIASASDDKTARIWSSEQQSSEQQIYRGHTRWVTTAAWSPDGTRIASGGNDTNIHIWEPATMRLLSSYNEHSYGIHMLAWSPDGTRIASCSWDKFVRVWNVESGRTLLTYRGHQDSVYVLAWSPDGTRIASAGKDKIVRVWNADDGSTLYTERGHKGWIFALAWSPDGTRIASAGGDKVVRVWKV